MATRNDPGATNPQRRARTPSESTAKGPAQDSDRRPRQPAAAPPLTLFATTLWEYPSQHYRSFVDEEGNVVRAGRPMQGDKAFEGATPSWVIWQLLMRYTRRKDLVVDPMAGSGTTLDVARDLGRRALGYDLAPTRDDIFRADARTLPLEDAAADFVFADPPYSTHITYSDDPGCIGKLDAAAPGPDGRPGAAYADAMARVISEMHRVLRPRRYAAIYVSDSWRKRAPGDPGEGAGVFMPIGVDLFTLARRYFRPVDMIAVVRQNQKLARGNWRKAAIDGNFFFRGFNHLMILKKT